MGFISTKISHIPQRPTQQGKIILENLDLMEVAQWIDWKYFFKAWKITGHYDGLKECCGCQKCRTAWLAQFTEEEKIKAQEALNLYTDALKTLKEAIENKRLKGNALLYFSAAQGEIDGIKLLSEENNELLYLPTLRQQHYGERNQHCASLCDFVSPQKDYIGIFACTIIGAKEWCEELKEDSYQSLLIQTIADRLVEALSEWLHQQVREKYWGYDKSNKTGIRPAFGYPSLPDLSLLFDIDNLVKLKEIGITLTENGAMYPNSSICGLYIAHPQSYYFIVGEIEEDQRIAYARQRNKMPEEIKRWLTTR